jgi:hypothetical protein
MQELRLIGVDGDHLRLSSEQGVPYRLPIDDALRAAIAGEDVRASPANAGAPAGVLPGKPARAPRPPVHLTPRDIQARIRSGATAEQVADEFGADLEHVRRYEGPVRAERDYVAYLAQRVEVASPVPSHEGYRSAFGDYPAQLGDMVAYRVRGYGIDPASLEWDSWRRPDGSWHVVARFDLPEGSRVDLGEKPPAWWTYNPTRKNIANGNRWAQVLSELEPLDGPLPSRRLSAVADRVFDFEAVKDGRASSDLDSTSGRSDLPGAADTGDPGDPGGPGASTGEQDGLLDVLRSRRGQRLGADEDGDDALAVLLTRGSIPAAHPRDGELVDGGDTGSPDLAAEAGPGVGTGTGTGVAAVPDDRPEPGDGHDRHDDGTPRLYDGVSTDTREISVFAQPSSSTTSTPAGQGTGNAKDDDADPAVARRVKPKRSSVPSWDDIVFGRRSE